MVQGQDLPSTPVTRENRPSPMTIAMLARNSGVGVETVRYYQRRGLLRIPERGEPTAGLLASTGQASMARASSTGGSIRRYDEADLRRLRFIRAAQAAGFTLDQIAELLTLDASEDRARALTLAKQRIAALDARIAELQAARNALCHLARQCDSDVPGPCPIIASFEH
jgi:MerR family transcriptional regulator, mercuric resistance operon regulatory protein